jgi:hypothetical protein
MVKHFRLLQHCEFWQLAGYGVYHNGPAYRIADLRYDVRQARLNPDGYGVRNHYGDTVRPPSSNRRKRRDRFRWHAILKARYLTDAELEEWLRAVRSIKGFRNV